MTEFLRSRWFWFWAGWFCAVAFYLVLIPALNRRAARRRRARDGR